MLSPSRHPPALPPSTQPPLPLQQPSPSGQEAPAEDGGSTMVKSCSPPGERLKRSILVHTVLNKEPYLVAGQSQTAFGGNRNPEESGGIQRNPEESGVNTGIPVPQEFLRKIPVKAKKNRNSCDPLQNHVPVKNSSGKRRKNKILRNPVRNGFLGPKKKS